jgi:hypothetical protein
MSGVTYDESLGPGQAAPAAHGVGRGAHHTHAMVVHFRATRPWVLFLAALGFVGAALSMGIAVIFVGSMAIVPGTSGLTGAGGVATLVIGVSFYVVVGVVSGFFAFLLLRYSRAIGQVIAQERTEDIEQALDAQRVLFKGAGIATIAGIGLSIVGMFGVIVAVALMASAAMP